jgi:hypothetical protein
MSTYVIYPAHEGAIRGDNACMVIVANNENEARTIAAVLLGENVDSFSAANGWACKQLANADDSFVFQSKGGPVGIRSAARYPNLLLRSGDYLAA